MKYNLLFLSFVFSMFISCKEKDVTENIPTPILSINIENKALKTDKPALSKLHYIKLETKDECLLEDVNKVIYHNNKLYILSTPGKGNIYVFDDKGKYLYKMTKGEGPENIMYPTDIAINADKKSLVVLDAYRNIKEYNLDNGKFLSKIMIKEPFFSIETIGNDMLLFDPNSRSKAKFYLRYLSQEKESKDLFPKSVKTSFFSLPNFFTKISNKEVLVSCIFSNTIFYINDTQQKLLPYLTLDFHEKNANTSQNLDEIQSLGKYMKNARERNLVTGPCDLCFFDENLFFTLKGANSYFVTYNVDKNSVLLHETLFDGLPNIYGSAGRTNKEVIFAIDMPWLMEYFNENVQGDSEVIQQLREICKNEDENPVLLFGSPSK